MGAINDKAVELDAITGSYFKSLYYSDGQSLNIELFQCISCGRWGTIGIGERVDSDLVVVDPFFYGESEEGGLELGFYFVLPFPSADGEREDGEGLELFFDCGVYKG